MQACDCIEVPWHHEVLMQYQYLSDIMIAFAYFFITLELLYFAHKSKICAYTRILYLFGAFILLCGSTHFLNLWTMSDHSTNVAKLMAVTKFSTAIVSCVTALMLVHIIPDLLSLKRHEVILKRKAEELDTEKCSIIREEESAQHARMLTCNIRSTLDKHTILETTLTELGRILDLSECALWMPSRRSLSMELTHSLNSLLSFDYCVPIHVPIVTAVFNSAEATRIPHTCPLARIRCDVRTDYPPEIVAIRIPLLKHSDFEFHDAPEFNIKCYAIMVLILPLDGLRRWRRHEIELVELAADQAAVALSHAEILEDSMRASNQLMEQNLALESAARQDAEMKIQARTDFLSVINHEMMTPMHAVIILSSLLLETEITPDQRFLMEAIQKNCNLLSVLVDDVLDLCRLNDGRLELDTSIFSVRDMFVEAMNFIKPIASAKKLSMDLNLDNNLPVNAIGDRKCLMHVIVHIVGNAVKFTKEGEVSVEASIATPEYLELCRTPGFCPLQSDSCFYLLVQVKDSGQGITSQDLRRVFTKFSDSQVAPHNRDHHGLGLAICKRFVKLMGGHIWMKSEGLGKGTTVTFVVRLGVCEGPTGRGKMKQILRGQAHISSNYLIGHSRLLQ